MKDGMNYSKQGLALTEGFEQCRLTTYPDSKGVLTIGWGHTGPDAWEGRTILQAQADAWLLADVQRAVYAVNAHVTVPITQDQFDAMVDFAFNAGVTAFANSTLLKKFNALDTEGTAEEFDRWVYSGGQMLDGLQRRRDAEERLFLA